MDSLILIFSQVLPINIIFWVKIMSWGGSRRRLISVFLWIRRKSISVIKVSLCWLHQKLVGFCGFLKIILDKFEQVQTSVDRFEQVQTSVDRFEQVHTSFYKFIQVHTTLLKFEKVHKSMKKFIQVQIWQAWTSLDKFKPIWTYLDQFVHKGTENNVLNKYLRPNTPLIQLWCARSKWNMDLKIIFPS